MRTAGSGVGPGSGRHLRPPARVLVTRSGPSELARRYTGESHHVAPPECLPAPAVPPLARCDRTSPRAGIRLRWWHSAAARRTWGGRAPRGRRSAAPPRTPGPGPARGWRRRLRPAARPAPGSARPPGARTTGREGGPRPGRPGPRARRRRPARHGVARAADGRDVAPGVKESDAWTPVESPWTLPSGLPGCTCACVLPGSRSTSWSAARVRASPTSWIDAFRRPRVRRPRPARSPVQHGSLRMAYMSMCSIWIWTN